MVRSASEPTEEPSSSDGSGRLPEELAHYRERWRATERIVDQRLTMLITLLSGAIAATVALLSMNTPSPTVDPDVLLGAVWLAIAIISEGIFLRLMRARRSICRNIATINYLRSAILETVPSDEQAVLRRVYALDSNLPRPFYVWGSVAASALVQSCAAVLVLWFWGPGVTERTPNIGIVLGGAFFIGNMVAYFQRSRRPPYDALLTEMNRTHGTDASDPEPTSGDAEPSNAHIADHA